MSNDPKKPAVDPIAEAVERAMKAALPAAVEAVVRTQAEISKQEKQSALDAANDVLKKNGIPGQKCGECRQKRKACKGQHRMAVIYPSNPRYAKSFDGLQLNGVVYRSNRRGHAIPVPADWDAEHMLAKWEFEEDQLRTGREGFHNSGEIGLKQSRVNTNPRGFRS